MTSELSLQVNRTASSRTKSYLKAEYVSMNLKKKRKKDLYHQPVVMTEFYSFMVL